MSGLNNGSVSGDTFPISGMNVTSRSSQMVFKLPDSTYDLIIMWLCILGTPGNVFVVAVYFRRMTTSMRAYMFVLGIADTAICVTGIFVLTGRFGTIGRYTILFVFNAAVTFSTCLLTFVATERCMAVVQPHNFSFNTRKAKTAVAVIAAVSMFCATGLCAMRVFGFERAFLISLMTLAAVCLLVVIASYTVMAVILLKRMKTSRNKISVVETARQTPKAITGTSTSKAEPIVSAFPSNAFSPPAGIQTMGVKAQRVTLVLFVVTVIFVVCWLPFFLRQSGVVVPNEMKRVFTINSVVNPFIYSFLSPMFRGDVLLVYQEIRARLANCL